MIFNFIKNFIKKMYNYAITILDDYIDNSNRILFFTLKF
jgi:hypothetical protein